MAREAIRPIYWLKSPEDRPAFIGRMLLALLSGLAAGAAWMAGAVWSPDALFGLSPHWTMFIGPGLAYGLAVIIPFGIERGARWWHILIGVLASIGAYYVAVLSGAFCMALMLAPSGALGITLTLIPWMFGPKRIPFEQLMYAIVFGTFGGCVMFLTMVLMEGTLFLAGFVAWHMLTALTLFRVPFVQPNLKTHLCTHCRYNLLYNTTGTAIPPEQQHYLRYQSQHAKP